MRSPKKLCGGGRVGGKGVREGEVWIMGSSSKSELVAEVPP